MNPVFKRLSLLVIVATLTQIFGKFYYFDAFKIFSFEIGYLCLIEVGLIFLFICVINKILNFYDDGSENFNKLKSKFQLLFLPLSFIAGVHFVGGEFQNTFILEKTYGPLMDMATFYDGIGHLFIFAFIFLLFYLLVKAESISKNKRKAFSFVELFLLFVQVLIFSIGAALTIVKSAFIALCMIPLLVLFLWTGQYWVNKKTLDLKSCPLFSFFFPFLFLTLVLLFIWLILPYNFKRPIIREYISLGEELDFETSLQENWLLDKITQTWEQ